jgi:ABC-2 type transport system permease protein
MIKIYIIWLRQIKRYFRSKPRLAASIVQPLLFLLALGFGFGPIFQKAGGGNYIQFLAPGIIGMAILTVSLFSGAEIIWDRQFGFLKEMLVAPISRLEIMIGRTLGGATVAVLQGIIVFLVALLVGFRPEVTLWPFAFIFMFLTAILFCALGTTIASLLTDMQGFQLIMNFLVTPLFFLSGALFPLQGLPQIFIKIAAIDPLSYGVDGLRASLIGGAHFGVLTDFTILGAVTTLFLVLGSYFFSKMEI